MLIGDKRFSDQIRQRFNKCTVYITNGSGGIKKGQKKQFVKACLYNSCSVFNQINLQTPKIKKNLMQHRFRIGESFSNIILEYTQ